MVYRLGRGGSRDQAITAPARSTAEVLASIVLYCTYSTVHLSHYTITDQPFCNFTLFLFFISFLTITSLRNYWDEGYLTLSLSPRFYLEKFCSVFVVIACSRFWTDLFAICGNTLSCRIQSPTTIDYRMSTNAARKSLSTISSFRYVLDYYLCVVWYLIMSIRDETIGGYTTSKAL